MCSDLTLTASETQARARRRNHNVQARMHGSSVWPAAQIISLDQFVRQQWLRSWPNEQLLSPSQELCLWQQAVEHQLRADNAHDDALIGERALARQFMQTAQLAARWNINPCDGPVWSAEQRLFRDTCLHLESTLKAQQAITTRQLPQAFISGLENGSIRPPASLEWLPLPGAAQAYQQHILHALSAHGCTVTQAVRERCANSAQPACLTSADEDALWLTLGQRLAEALRTQPDLPLIVAVPLLDSKLMQRIESSWRHIFATDVLDEGCTGDTSLWGFQRSPSLAQHPAVDLALRIVELNAHDNRFEALSGLLLHPLLFRARWREACAVLEVRLREQGAQQDIASLQRYLRDDGPEGLRTHVHQLVDAVKATPAKASAADWLAHWKRCWMALDYHTSGAEWPLREEFDQVLLEFSGLDHALGHISQSEATSWLKQIAQRQRYQPEGAREAPIQVCELLDAVDQPAAALYLVDMHDRAWPSPARPNPFLRLEDQISAGLPQACAETQLADARLILDTLQQQHSNLEVWCALSNSQGAETHPTPLIPGPWQHMQAPQLGQPHKHARLPENDPAPALSPQRQSAQTGGVSIVQAQAYGGFFAFARHRLKLRALEKPLEGLSPLAQGQWIHHVLQTFWQDHRCQSVLLGMDDDALLADLGPRVAAGTARFVPLGRYGRQLQATETDRILRSCMNWLKHEKRRTDPFEVLHCEVELEDHIDPLTFRLRIDRIDRCITEHGPRYLVIDYKTGSNLEERYWKTHQFYEPQLPLYATSERLSELEVPHVDGICFAQVDETHPAFIASLNWRRRLIEDSEKAFHVDWDGIIADWRTRLAELVSEFCAGSVEYDSNQDYRRRYAVADLLPLIDQTCEDDDA